MQNDFNKSASKAKAMPELEQFTPINITRYYEPGQPVILISLNTNSGECRNIAPFYVQLHDKYPRLHFRQVSFQNYDDLINNFSNIPELMKLNVSHDNQKIFKLFLIRHNTLSIPHMFIFNRNGTLLFDGHPLAKVVEGHLARANGQTLLLKTFRAPSPLPALSPKRAQSPIIQKHLVFK